MVWHSFQKLYWFLYKLCQWKYNYTLILISDISRVLLLQVRIFWRDGPSYGVCGPAKSFETCQVLRAENKALFILLQGDQVIPIKVACVVYWGWGRSSQTWSSLILKAKGRTLNHSDLSLFRQKLRSTVFYFLGELNGTVCFNLYGIYIFF